MKTCLQCNTENNAEYKYCKFCGAELPCIDKKPLYEEETAEQNQTETENNATDNNEVTIAEMQIFVSKNSEKIVPKFIEMQKKLKKTSWCWPVFILGFIFGYIGMAGWFLYRKMYKIAIILLAVGMGFGLIDLIVNLPHLTTMFSGVYNLLESFIGNIDSQSTDMMSFDFALNGIIADYENESIKIISLISEWVGQYILPIIMGIYSLHFYKRHAIAKVINCKNTASACDDLNMILYREGGTSVGAVVIGIITYIAIDSLLSSIPLILSFINIF